MKTPFKIIFAGTPAFAVPTLQLLLKNHYSICAVLTQPDRPSGRGQKLSYSPVKEIALKHQLNILQFSTLRTFEAEKTLIELQADLMVVVAYGLLLPKNILTIPKRGCINVHASLLPRWRGAAPIQHVLLKRDILTGVSIMHMDEGLDTGPLYLQSPYVVQNHTTSQTLYHDLAQLGAQSLIQTLKLISENQLIKQHQHDSHACYAPKIKKEDGLINWEKSAQDIEAQIRALAPWPAAYTLWNGICIKIFEARILLEKHLGKHEAKPGTILSISKKHLEVACGEHRLGIYTLQVPNKKILNISHFLQNNYFTIGHSFNSLSTE